MARRKVYLFVCVNRRPDGTPKGSCATRGAESLHAELKATIAARGMAATTVRACTASCLDVCWAGPAIAIGSSAAQPTVFYGRVQLSDVSEIVDAIANGTVVERLLLPDGDFDAATAGPSLPEQPSHSPR